MIIMIDDEFTWIKGYIEAIQQSDIEHKYFKDVDSSWEFIKKNIDPDNDLVILDIMLPPGERYKDINSENGRTTGEYFYNDLKELYPNLRIIILTNKNKEDNKDKFVKPKTIFRTKEETDCIELINIILNFLVD